VIELITHTERGTSALIMGETIWETDCLSLLHDDLGAEGFPQIFIISEQAVMFTIINLDKECQLLGRNHHLQWQCLNSLGRWGIITSKSHSPRSMRYMSKSFKEVSKNMFYNN
jgi:hypothetical protein